VVQGLAIGTFMGVLAAVDMLLLIGPAIAISIANVRPTAVIVNLILRLTAALLTLPGIIFGGSWLSLNTVLHLEVLSDFSVGYTLSLTIVFLIIVAFPLAQWVLKFGRTIGGSL